MSRCAVILGAGQGMGRAVALRLARDGYAVHLLGRTAGKLAEVAAEIAGEVRVHPLDAGDLEQVKRVVAELPETVDVFVHCAGQSLMKSLSETTIEDWDEVIRVNLTSAYLTTRALLERLLRSANPTVAYVVSKVALRGYPVVAYTAAKTGLLGFARALEAEQRGRLRVGAICPGPVDTPMRAAATPDMPRELIMDAGAVAQTVSYLAGLPAGVTTGELLVQAAWYD